MKKSKEDVNISIELTIIQDKLSTFKLSTSAVNKSIFSVS